jgi:hypothetical protein
VVYELTLVVPCSDGCLPIKDSGEHRGRADAAAPQQVGRHRLKPLRGDGAQPAVEPARRRAIVTTVLPAKR